MVLRQKEMRPEFALVSGLRLASILIPLEEGEEQNDSDAQTSAINPPKTLRRNNSSLGRNASTR